jgi:hypothetical protein
VQEPKGESGKREEKGGLKAVDWRNTFINRAKLWKAHAHEDTVERLALCAKWGAVPLLRQLLLDARTQHGDDDNGDAWVRDVINQKTRLGGKTVLHWACEYGNAGVVEHLVAAYGRRGLDLNSRADIAAVGLWPVVRVAGGVTAGRRKAPHVPLSLASESGHLAVVQLLLEQEDVRSIFLQLLHAPFDYDDDDDSYHCVRCVLTAVCRVSCASWCVCRVSCVSCVSWCVR